MQWLWPESALAVCFYLELINLLDVLMKCKIILQAIFYTGNFLLQ